MACQKGGMLSLIILLPASSWRPARVRETRSRPEGRIRYATLWGGLIALLPSRRRGGIEPSAMDAASAGALFRLLAYPCQRDGQWDFGFNHCGHAAGSRLSLEDGLIIRGEGLCGPPFLREGRPSFALAQAVWQTPVRPQLPLLRWKYRRLLALRLQDTGMATSCSREYV